MDRAIFQVWRKGIFSFVAKMLFIKFKQMKFLAILVSDKKLRKLNILLFSFAL